MHGRKIGAAFETARHAAPSLRAEASSRSDRVRAGAVFDFLDFYIRAGGKDWHWPAFNVADSAITVGVILLLFHGLFQAADRAKTEHS